MRAGDSDVEDMGRPAPYVPSLPWRVGSVAAMAFIGSCARSFLYGLNNMEVTGLEGFLEALERRKDIDGRERGLITGTLAEAGRSVISVTVAKC